MYQHLKYTTELQEDSSWNKYQEEKEFLQVEKSVHGYEVANIKTGGTYKVTKWDGHITCTCPDFRYRGKWSQRKNYNCKHKIAVFFFNEELKKLRDKEVEESVEKMVPEKETCGFCGLKYNKADMAEAGTCKNCKNIQSYQYKAKDAAEKKSAARKVTVITVKDPYLKKICDRW